MADTVHELATAICWKDGAVGPDARLVDSDHAAFEQTIVSSMAREPSVCGAPTAGVGDDLRRQ